MHTLGQPIAIDPKPAGQGSDIVTRPGVIPNILSSDMVRQQRHRHMQ